MEETVCRTFANKKTYLNTWIIEEFSKLRHAVKLTSPQFSGANLSGQRMVWNYVLEKPSSFALVNINVTSNSCGSDTQIVHVEIENNKTTDYIIKPRDPSGLLRGCSGSINCSQMHSQNDDTLTLRCKISLIAEATEQVSSAKHAPLPELPVSRLVENFSNILMNNKFADLTVTVGSQSFRAHKAILVARSTVFAAMFQHDMQEAQRNEITIKDMEPRVFKEVLRFIYTDKVEGLQQMACELLAAADRYDLARLKVMCEIALFEGITVGSATKTLIFADLHRAKELKARAIQFIGQHMKAMANWGEFCSARPDLVAEILNGVAASK